ncbi:MAG: DUF1552 domain-containing protein [Deltaproteobacteria bacterium]|nr:DUF1552 domain-containing protein [Deltaproteobacteria bacterium]
MTPSSRLFTRRHLLKAAGLTLTTPMFLRRAFASEAEAQGPPALVLLMQTNGTNQKNFWPAPGTFDSPILRALLNDPRLAAQTTLIKGINYQAIKSPSGNEHDRGFHGLYSGFDSVLGPGGSFGGGISLDQRIANEVPSGAGSLRHIHCGVHAVNYKAINAGRISFSATGRMQQAPCELDIYRLYETVFGASKAAPPDPESAKRRLAQKRSILDSVADDLRLLENRLGPQERAKVQLHATAVRDFERRLTSALPPRAAACAKAQPAQRGVPSFGQGNEANAEILCRLFIEFIANTVACNMVGVLSFQFGRGGEHFHYDWLKIPGMPSDAHDFVAHQDQGDPEIERINTEIKKWYTSLIADLGERLLAFPSTDGRTALDNSLIVWGNELATGPHGMSDIPVVMLGGARGRMKTRGQLIDAGPQPHHRLGCTLLNIMGVRAAGFGGLAMCGPLQGVQIQEPN